MLQKKFVCLIMINFCQEWKPAAVIFLLVLLILHLGRKNFAAPSARIYDYLGHDINLVKCIDGCKNHADCINKCN